MDTQDKTNKLQHNIVVLMNDSKCNLGEIIAALELAKFAVLTPIRPEPFEDDTNMSHIRTDTNEPKE